MIGVAFATLSAVAYAVTSVLVRRGVRSGPADNGLLLTTMINVVILAACAAIAHRPVELTQSTVTGMLWFATSGVLASFLGRGCFFAGIARIGPPRSAAIKNTSPVFSIAVAVLVLGEDVSLLGGLAIAIVICALALMVVEAWRDSHARHSVDGILATDASLDGILVAEPSSPSEGRRGSGAPLGVGVALSAAAAVFFGTGQVVRKTGLSYLPEAVLGALIAALTSLVVHACSLSVRGRFRESMKESLQRLNMPLLGAGLSSTVGMLAFFGAIRYLPVAYVATIAATEAIFTIALTRILLGRHEAVPLLAGLACCMVFAGAALLAFSVSF
ncbi:MAG: hypothetical protein QOE19_3708 [Actinomycetota bacterium]|nr:hypothetical protein [Actinomycetota bacterium]